MLIFKVKGSLTIKYINIIGVATLNKQMLLHITAWHITSTKNKIIRFIVDLPMINYSLFLDNLKLQESPIPPSYCLQRLSLC